MKSEPMKSYPLLYDLIGSGKRIDVNLTKGTLAGVEVSDITYATSGAPLLLTILVRGEPDRELLVPWNAVVWVEDVR